VIPVVRIELLLVLRDRRALLAGVLMVFLVACVPHLMVGWLDGGPQALLGTTLVVPADPVEGEGEVVWEVVGEAPAWVDLPEALSPPEALVRFWTEDGGESGVHFEVLGTHSGARLDDVAEQVKLAAFAERQRRSESVGQAGPWRQTVDLVFAESPVPPTPVRWPRVPWGAALVLLAAAMGSLSWVMEAIPRARSGGWLESLAVVPGGRSGPVLAWLVVATCMALLGALVGLAGHGAGAAVSGEAGLGPRPWLLPVGVLLLVPVQLLAFLTASDLRASVMRSLWVLPGFSLLVALALLLLGTSASLAPWVPVGGIVVACLGLVGPSSLPWALAVGLAVAAVATAACVALVDAGSTEVSSVGATARRRARGNWLPEIALLVALGISSVVAWSPALWGTDVTRVLLTSHLVFYALPALVAPRVLSLPFAELVPVRWPGWRPLGLGVLGVGATLGFAVLVTGLQQLVWPLDPFWSDLVEQTFAPMAAGWTLLLLSLLPGVCEELLFRGAVLGLLRKCMGSGPAIVVQAVVFAVAHLYGFRWLPTFGVGLATGWLTVKTRSLWPAIVLHTLHNGLAAWLGTQVELDFGSMAVLVGFGVAGGIGFVALLAAGGGERDG